MKNYRITVNGNVYDVQVEELHGNVTPSPRVAAPAPTPVAAPAAAPAQATAPAPAPAAAPATGGESITAPMPGNILDIRVSAGDKIGENQVVIILEAMKMENEITSPFAGTVASVNVSKGQSVNSGDVLVTIAK